jgi:hypothetical protein
MFTRPTMRPSLPVIAALICLGSMGGLPFNRPADNGSPFPTGKYANKRRRGKKHTSKSRKKR